MPTIIRNMRGVSSTNQPQEKDLTSDLTLTSSDREFLTLLKEKYTGDNQFLKDFLAKYASK
jgi:hypothetical protein